MTGMLASVTDASEAEIAVNAGADLIDCKDPRGGALGALPVSMIDAIRRQVAGRRPVSATVGDLPATAAALVPAVRRIAATGVDFVKLGLFRTVGIDPLLAVHLQGVGLHGRHRWRRSLGCLSLGHSWQNQE